MDITSDVHEIMSAGVALNGGSIVELTINEPNYVAKDRGPRENYYFRIVPNQDSSTNSMNKPRNNKLFNIPPLRSSA